MTLSLTVYSKPGCQQCAATTRTLDRKGIPYTVVDVSADAAALDLVQELGYRQVPVVVIGNDWHWTGFRPDLISEIAG